MSQQPEKFDGSSVSITDEQKAKLKGLFPEIITEGGKIDFDRLKLTLGESVDVGKERYGMNWPGKADCFKTIQRPSMATLVPARDESVNFDTTENLIIEGDNLETLKLLQKSYLGKVKMIFIDPPYNTGNDFIYPDDYSESLETYLRYTGQVDKEGRKFSTNSETDGRFHSRWMNMMYPRLFLARNLLRDDGAIFVCIDDNEVAGLKLVMNEIFGDENFVADIVWNHTQQSKNDEKYFSRHHNQILVFRKSEKLETFQFERTEKDNQAYANPDNDPKGLWRAGDFRSPHLRNTLRFSITAPSGKIIAPPENGWRWSEESVKAKIASGEIIFSKDETRIVRKIYLSEQEGRTPENLWLSEFAGTTRNANSELKELFDEPPFDTPKPTMLIRRMMVLAMRQDGDIAMDFFAGSGTTAHALLQQNSEDDVQRKFILVQLPENTGRTDHSTISDIAKERVRRVIRKLDGDNNQLALGSDKKQDRGFKVFKLQSSNFRAWNSERPKDDAELVKQLTLHTDHLVAGRTQEDVLYELLLKSGFPLDTKVEKITLAGKSVFSIADGAMLICLEKELTPEVIKAMAEKKPERVVCLDAGFADNDQLKTNAVQTMKSKGVTKFQTV